MRKSKIINWNNKEVVCKELVMAEIDELMDSDQAATMIDNVFFDRVPATAVTKSTGLSYEELNDCPPSQLAELWDAVEEVNPFFLKSLNHLAAAGRKLADLSV